MRPRGYLNTYIYMISILWISTGCYAQNQEAAQFQVVGGKCFENIMDWESKKTKAVEIKKTII